MRKLFAIIVMALGLLIFSCSRKTSSQSSVSDAKKEVTGYNTSVKQLIQAKCAPCHIPSAGGNKAPLDTYEAAKKLADEIVRRIQLTPGERGFMPFRKEKLSDEEISVFKKWLSDGTAE